MKMRGNIYVEKIFMEEGNKKACSATEGLEDTFANYLTKSPGVKDTFGCLPKLIHQIIYTEILSLQ